MGLNKLLRIRSESAPDSLRAQLCSAQVFAGKTLKELYPSSMHVNCVAHLLHNCAIRVRAHF